MSWVVLLRVLWGLLMWPDPVLQKKSSALYYKDAYYISECFVAFSSSPYTLEKKPIKESQGWIEKCTPTAVGCFSEGWRVKTLRYKC